MPLYFTDEDIQAAQHQRWLAALNLQRAQDVAKELAQVGMMDEGIRSMVSRANSEFTLASDYYRNVVTMVEAGRQRV